MPLFVNETALKELSTVTGVAEDKLKAELFMDVDDETKVPKTTKIKDAFADIVVIGKTALDLAKKEKFDEGKHQSHAQLVKTLLGEKAFDVPKDMTREKIAEQTNSILKTQWEMESGKSTDAKVLELMEEKKKLQNSILEKEKIISEKTKELDTTRTFSTAREKVISAVSEISFSATGEKLLKQRGFVVQNILSSYQHKNEEGISVWYKDGKKLVDNLQNPMTIEDIVKGESIIFDQEEATEGRSGKSSKQKNSSGELDAELVKAESLADISTILSKRGLSAISQDGRAIISKWNELHKKKA